MRSATVNEKSRLKPGGFSRTFRGLYADRVLPRDSGAVLALLCGQPSTSVAQIRQSDDALTAMVAHGERLWRAQSRR